MKFCANSTLSLQISPISSVLVGEPSGGAHDSAKTGVGCVALNRRQPAFRRAPACLRAALPPRNFSAALRPALASPVKRKNDRSPKKSRGSAVRRPAEKPIGSKKVHLENQIFCRLVRACVWACGARTRNACVAGGAVKQSALPALS